jgi:DNA-binding XRE family transcriptional regulator
MKSQEETLKLIGEKLKLLRLNVRENQEEVAENVGINRKTLIQIENGANFSMSILLNLLQEYGRLDDFINILSLPQGFDIKKYNKALNKLLKEIS